MKVRNKKKLVYGAGVNNADYPVHAYAVIGSRRKRLWVCPVYQVWASMLSRCYCAKTQARQPTYVGCTVAPEWHYFSSFRTWMIEQDWEGNQLDKDILIPGNKVYSASSCVFVSRDLNGFLNSHGSARGEWPIGVNWHKAAGKFIARCRNPFTGSHDQLGLFACPSEAHEAWRARKHELACQYADMQSDPRIAASLRARYASAQPDH